MKYVETAGALTTAECAELVEACDTAEFVPAWMYINGRKVVDPARRKSRLAYLPVGDSKIQKLHTLMQRLNKSVFQFDISNWLQGELLLYAAELGENFNWHADDPLWYSRPVYRKLTGVCQLVPPTEYVGGELQIRDIDGTVITPSRDVGTLVVFPSFYLHRVTPVTEGTRKTVVTFGTGPMWK